MKYFIFILFFFFYSILIITDYFISLFNFVIKFTVKFSLFYPNWRITIEFLIVEKIEPSQTKGSLIERNKMDKKTFKMIISVGKKSRAN